MPSVLYVDDEPDLLEMGKVYLERTEVFTVDTARSAREALDALAERAYDAVVSDYRMPDMDGIAFLKEVRTRYGDLPFILFTGKGREEVVIQAINNGADFYLQKGGDPKAQFAELAHQIRQAVRRKHAEDDLKRSETLYRAVFDNTGTATILVAPDTTILRANIGWENLTGIPRSEQENRLSWTDFIARDDIERMKQYHHARRSDPRGVPTVYECRLVDTKKRLHYCYVHVDMIPGTQNSVASLVDITPLKQAEKALSMSEQDYRSIIENMQDAFYRTDHQGNLTMVSPSFAHEMGYPDEKEVLGKNIQAEFYADPAERQELLRRLEHGEKVREHRITLRRRDGSPVVVSASSHVLHDERGNPAGVEGILRDMTETIKAEDALRESEERFREIFDKTSDAIYLLDIDGTRQPRRFIDLNAAACRLLGYSRDELLGMSPVDVSTGHYDPPFEAIVQEMVEGGNAIFESEHIRKDGTIVPVEINAHVVTLQGRPVVLAVSRDITGRKQASRDLRLQLAFVAALQNARTLDEILDACLSAAIDLPEMDAGGIYLVDSGSGGLDLAISRNLSDRFVASVSHFSSDSSHAALAMAGRPVYLPYDSIGVDRDDVQASEGLHAVAIVPIVTDGQVIACLDVASRRFDAVPMRARVVLETISTFIGSALARIRAENALHAAKEHYKSLIAHMTEGVALHELVCDGGTPVEYRIIDANPAFESILGIPKERTLGKTSREAYGVAEPPYLDLYRLVAVTGTPATFETYFAPVDRHFSISAYSPKRGQFATVFTDITERKKAEESLRRSEERYRLLADNVEDVIWVFDTVHGRLSYVSPSVEKLLGFTPPELVGRPIEDLVPANEIPALHAGIPRRLAAFEAGDDTARVETEPLDHVRKDGTIVNTEMVTTLLAGPDRRATAILGVSRDCTDRKRAEDALLHANRQLQMLSSITRHDILNKISVLRGYLDIAGGRSSDPMMTEMIGKAASIAATINEQIDFTRLYENLGSQKPQWQALARTLPWSQAPEELALDVSLDGIEVFADPMLPKVFSNLLDNSVRHGERVTRIRIHAGETDGGLSIVWEDDGIGIPSVEKARIFERGYGKNTGLGLFLVREILAITGIAIQETGEPGTGARFEILVPKSGYRTSGGMRSSGIAAR